MKEWAGAGWWRRMEKRMPSSQAIARKWRRDGMKGKIGKRGDSKHPLEILELGNSVAA